MEKSEWMTEIRIDEMVFAPGTEFSLIIRYSIQLNCSERNLINDFTDAKQKDSI